MPILKKIIIAYLLYLLPLVAVIYLSYSGEIRNYFETDRKVIGAIMLYAATLIYFYLGSFMNSGLQVALNPSYSKKADMAYTLAVLSAMIFPVTISGLAFNYYVVAPAGQELNYSFYTAMFVICAVVLFIGFIVNSFKIRSYYKKT